MVTCVEEGVRCPAEAWQRSGRGPAIAAGAEIGKANVANRDTQLLARIADGDAGAFAALYDRHAPRLLGFLTRMLGERAEAEDVLQVTFLQVWRRAVQFDPGRAGAAAWLHVVARSRATDVLRRRRPVVSADAATEDASASPDTRLAQEDTREDVERALKHLPENQRSAIRLAFYAGMTHVQIADRLSVPLGTVKTWIRRGMHQLKSLLEGPQEVSA